jgi:archaellum biogenesis ATPase FlaH
MNALLSKSLEDGDIHLLFSFPKELLSRSEKSWLDWIVSYVTRYGSPPSLKRLGEEFSTFIPITTTDPLGDIYDRTLVKKRNIYTREYMTLVQDELKKGADPLPIIEKLHSVIRGGKSDVTRYTTYDRTAYYRRPTTFPYEIPVLDQHTGGISAGDLAYVVGRLGTGKTTLTLWLVSKWLQKGKRILMVSNENRADDVIVKMDAYVGGFNPIKKRTLQWSDDDLNRLKTVSFIARHMEGEMFIPNKPVQNVEEVQSLIYTYRPDVVVVDGIYLMQGVEGSSNWEKITSISRSLKQLADGEGVPVLGIHQASRNAVGRRMEIEHVAYADALAQDCDILLSVNPEDDGRLYIESLKSRWGKSGWGFFCKMFFDTMSVKIYDATDDAKGDV